MSCTDIPSRFQPENDPEHNRESSEELFLRGFSTDSDIVRPDGRPAQTISEAEDAYVGMMRAEAHNDAFSIGTKHSRAKSRYCEMLHLDRIARDVFEEPAVGMQTLVFDPTKVNQALGPVEQTELTTEGATRAIRRTRERLQGNKYIYFAVRDIDSNGCSHWHVNWCIDVADNDGDSLDLLSGVEAHVRHCEGATDCDHPATEAVKWDPRPNSTAESYGSDSKHGGGVHPCARYVAGSLPHLGVVGQMTPRQVRHGTVEWAASSKAYKSRNRTSLPSEFDGFS